MSHNESPNELAFVQGQANVSEAGESAHGVDIKEHEVADTQEKQEKQDFEPIFAHQL